MHHQVFLFTFVKELQSHTTSYIDNYFNSLALVSELHNKNFLAAGAARVNHFKAVILTPDKELKAKKRGLSKQEFSRDGKVCITKWLDNHCVVLACNFVGVGKEENVKRWDKTQKKYVEISRPEVISAYNK